MQSNFPLENILSMRKPEDASKFLDVLESENYSWRNVGNDETNYPRLAISRSGVKAIIERITNAIDSILENEKELRKKPEDDKIASPRDAIQNWFAIKNGHISALNEKERRAMAQKFIEVILDNSGIEKRPTITVKDKGIGMHPDDFHKTVVGLQGSLKRSKHYLLGAYGWGGSQTFIWCNKARETSNVKSLPLAIIASRKNPKLLSNDQKDEVGWTIIRYRDMPNEKHGVFQYLVDPEGKIPRTSPSNLPTDFSHGTWIIHLAYDLEKFYGRMTLTSYRVFQSLLFDPILPFWLYDNREKPGEGRTISGNLSRLSTDEKGFIEYSNVQNQEMPFGTIKLRYWVLKPKKDGGFYTDSYIERPGSPNTIFITLNGQQYGTLSKQIIKDAGFSFLSDFLIFQIECDFLPASTKKGIFPSTREDICDDYKDHFKNEIISILQSDDELKRLEDARKKDSLKSGNEDSIKRVRKLLDKLITFNKKLTKGKSGKGERGTEKKKFKSKEPPTSLEIIPKNRDLELIPGEEKKVIVETDAADDFLIRDENPGFIECSVDNSALKCKIRSGFLRNGKINFYVTVEKNISIGMKGKLICKLGISGKSILERSKNIEVVNEPPPLPTFYPPTNFEITNEETPLNIKCGKRSLIQISCDGPDGLLERPEEKADLNVSFLPDIGIKVIGKSDLVNHRIRVFLQCPDSVDVGKRSDILCKLTLANQSSLTAQRSCIVIQPPPSTGGEQGTSEIEVPNYRIQEVEPDDENWNGFQWDENNVGKFMKSGEELILYISLGNKYYLKNLENKKLTTDIVELFKEKYVAYIGFHLWLMFESSHKISMDTEQQQEELNRICQTVLLSLEQDPRFR